MPEGQVNGWAHACFKLTSDMASYLNSAGLKLGCATCKHRPNNYKVTHMTFFRMCTNNRTKKISSCTRFVCDDCAEGFKEKHHL